MHIANLIMKEPKFKVGQVWRDRTNTCRKIININKFGELELDVGVCYGDGRTSMDGDSAGDLIELVPPPPSLPAPKFKVGQVWKTRAGEHVKIDEIDGGGGLKTSNGLSLWFDGQFYIGSESENDLVKLITDALPPNPIGNALTPDDIIGAKFPPNSANFPCVHPAPPVPSLADKITQFRALHAELSKLDTGCPFPAIVVDDPEGSFTVYGLDGSELWSYPPTVSITDVVRATGYPVYKCTQATFEAVRVVNYEVQP